MIASQTGDRDARLQRLLDHRALEFHRMMSVTNAPTRRATCLTQIRVHKFIRGHEFGCPLRTPIVTDSQAKGKTVLGGRLPITTLPPLGYWRARHAACSGAHASGQGTTNTEFGGLAR